MPIENSILLDSKALSGGGMLKMMWETHNFRAAALFSNEVELISRYRNAHVCVVLRPKITIRANVRRQVDGLEFSSLTAKITGREKLSFQQHEFLLVVKVPFMNKPVNT